MKRVLTLAMILLAPHTASAQLSNAQKVKCAGAYEQAQRTRNEGLYRASREHMLVCADEGCPKVLRDECVKWLGELDNAMPTVLVVAKDEKGNELSDVSVSVDGTKLVDHLDGKALSVDPGTRTFRFTRAGSDTVEQKVLIREGEKRRIVNVTFTLSTEPPPAPAKDAPSSKGSGSVPTATWILGGVGVVALGLSVPMYASYFRFTDSDCARAGTCEPSHVDAAKRNLIYANITSAVGGLALGAAIVLWVTAPSGPTAVSAGLAPTPGGVAGSLRVVF